MARRYGEGRGRGSMPVRSAGKPPKLRWQPGSFVRVGEQLYEVMYCFRVKDEPHEWHICLEERVDLSGQPTDAIGLVAEKLGLGQDTPRIVFELFRDHSSAMSFFMDGEQPDDDEAGNSCFIRSTLVDRSFEPGLEPAFALSCHGRNVAGEG